MTSLPRDSYLSTDQQDLLLAALTSNSNGGIYPQHASPPLPLSYAGSPPLAGGLTPASLNGFQPTDYDTPPHSNRNSLLLQGYNSGQLGVSPMIAPHDLEYDLDLDVDGHYDFDGAQDLENYYANSETFNDGEHEKRKIASDDADEGSSSDHNEPEPKRREGEPNPTAKKPGRKPLTSEPTSKRKAQNRAAQRAFRERKEKHLKDLETKVEDLQKESEATNHENSMLRAQVDRLQLELQEYKRRLNVSNMQRTAAARNPNITNGSGGFNFEFPLFGQTGNGQLFNNSAKNGPGYRVGPGGILERSPDANGAVTEEKSEESHTSASNTERQRKPSYSSELASLFSPSILKSIKDDYVGNEPTKAFSNNGGDSSDSPSSVSHSSHTGRGPFSSAGTTPEPHMGSPSNSGKVDPLQAIREDKTVSYSTTPNGDTIACYKGEDDEYSFCEKLNMACGNPHNPVPQKPSFTKPEINSIPRTDLLEQQSKDPELFSEYRESGETMNQNLGMSFFDDAFPGADFGSLSPGSTHIGKTPAGLKEIEDDDEEEMPVEEKNLLSCNKIWDRISVHPRFVSGELDMDGLCNELRSKAKCSESGVVISEQVVDQLLGMKQGKPAKDTLVP